MMLSSRLVKVLQEEQFVDWDKGPVAHIAPS